MPTTGKIIQQANLIFEKFHQHLLSFEKERMCQCGACRAVNNLSIKFIIHTGLVSGFHLGSHFKLIGKDVLILHRLLKNSIPVNEYPLFTEPFFKMLESNKLNSQKLSVINESDEFDNVLIKYKYIPINHWLQEIKIPIKEGL
jgi:hypothetical protein